MTRFTLAAVATLLLVAAPVVAQTTAPQGGPQTKGQTPAPAAPSAGPTPGSEEWLRLRGESYSAAPEAEQDPTEVAETIRLNVGIAARNDAAERREVEAAAAWQAEDSRWRAETARLETQRAQWEADAAAAEAARLRYERERAAWEAEMAACQRTGRCLPSAPKY
ncbi:cell wall hydrolase [Brevundimonas sp.]|uniref:cell wall hydrolase n=1 Tax=Brevundimonas sp. TaxID=1871086 RepID=UPI00272FA8B3|nr:cell wall hydrolase [Brevundimonas sp.]MDP1912934.1 cell wall hydrolase [Brevundimonas sp.]